MSDTNDLSAFLKAGAVLDAMPVPMDGRMIWPRLSKEDALLIERMWFNARLNEPKGQRNG